MDQNKLKNTQHRFDKKAMNDPKMMMIVPNMMMIDLNMMTIDPNMMMIDPKMMMIDPNMMMIDPKRMTIIFGENRDYKTIIREPFANDLAHMFDD